MIKNHILYNNSLDWRFNISRAEGSYVWDHDNKKLIDFTSGWNVVNLGWNNPELYQVIAEQAKKNMYTPMWTADQVQNEYADAFIQSLPREISVVSRAAGGMEANEEAIKTALAYTGRKKILSFKETYHGQSLATQAIGFPAEHSVVRPTIVNRECLIQMDYPAVFRDEAQNGHGITLEKFGESLETFLSKGDIAAIITEAGIVTGWGSTAIAPAGYLTLIRKLTKKYGTLLILDEIGTGFSRCGKLFGMQLEDVVPDIATFAKGASNGIAAIGTMVTTEEIAEKTFSKSNLTSTFGWVPLACAVGKKVLEIHQRDKIWQKAEEDGKYMLSQLINGLSGHPLVEDINGKGMEVGVRFMKTGKQKSLAAEVVEKAQEKGLHLVYALENNIQIMPPLTITGEDLDEGMDILVSVIRGLTL